MLYKIMPRALWESRVGAMPWAPVDRADGFVHLSDADQVRETAAKHFAGQTGLLLLDVDPAKLAPETLKWEPSRGGALFPHVYGDVPVEAVARIRPLPWTEAGFVFPEPL